MAVGIEYTQVFTDTAGGAGVATAYFQLGYTPYPAAGSVFVVKYLSVSSTVGLANTVPVYSVQVLSSATNSGGVYVMSTSNAAYGANVPNIMIDGQTISANVDKVKEVILNQAYIGFKVNMVGAGTFTIAISYSLIPSTNVLATNFLQTNGARQLDIPAIAPGSSTQILKSIIVSNILDTDPTHIYQVQLVMATSGAVAVAYLSPKVTIPVGGCVCYGLPTYIQPSAPYYLYGLITLSGGGTSDLNYYVSYIQEN